jgi:hypothetical protein
LLPIAERLGHPSFLVGAYGLVGEAKFVMGDLHGGIQIMRLAMEAVDSCSSTAALYGIDGWLLYSVFLGWAEQIGGHPDRAREWVERVLSRGRQHPHTYSRAWNLMGVSYFYLLQGETESASKIAEESCALSSERSFGQTLGMAEFTRICVECVRGQAPDPSVRLRAAMETLEQAWGANLMNTFMKGMHTKICLELNFPGSAQESLTRCFDIAHETGESMFLAELHRLQGEVLLGSSKENVTEAEQRFREAMELAQKQGAKLYELRATVSLARLQASDGRQREARKNLGAMYNWFTEGFDTADLKVAKALLDELGDSP